MLIKTLNIKIKSFFTQNVNSLKRVYPSAFLIFTPFVGIVGAHPRWAQLGFQEPASPVMEGIIDFHHDLMFFLVFILGFVCWFLLNIGAMFFNRFPATMVLRRQIHSKHISFIRRPSLTSHNLWLEIIWTIIPALILVSIVLPSFALIYSMDEFFLHPRLTLKAIGNQWYWTYNYGCSLSYSASIESTPSAALGTGGGCRVEDECIGCATVAPKGLPLTEELIEFLDAHDKEVNGQVDTSTNDILDQFSLSEIDGFLNVADAPDQCFECEVIAPKVLPLVEELIEHLNRPNLDIPVVAAPALLEFLTGLTESQIDEFLNVADVQDQCFECEVIAPKVLPLVEELIEFLDAHDKNISELCEASLLDILANFTSSQMDEFLDDDAILNEIYFFKEQIFEILEITGKDVLDYAKRCEEEEVATQANTYRHHFAIKFDSYMKPTEYLNEYQIRLLETDKRVILPTQTGIRVLISSYDVLHSWAIPSLGIKLDGCPGRLNQTFLYIKDSGLFYGQCSEICGTQHAFMPISIRAIPAHEFNFWLAQQVEQIAELSKNLEASATTDTK